MAKITLDQIAEELKSENWKVLSTEYKNLSTEMCFQCDEGHKVYTTWGKLRTRRECPMCKQNAFKENKNEILPKKKGEKRILALDQAGHITGWSIFDGRNLVKFGVFQSEGNDEIERFHDIKMWLYSMVKQWQPDLVGIEGIQYQQNFGVTTFQTLARLQGILMESLFEIAMPYKVCPTNTWRAHCGVKGSTRADKKKSMQILVKQWFDVSATDDESDAIGIGKYVADTFGKQVDLVEW